MGRLGNISGKEAVKAFQKAGWQPIGQVGSHVVMIKLDMRVNQPYSLDSTVREIEAVKPIDKASQGGVSNPTGCNVSEPTGSLVRANNNGRALAVGLKAAPPPGIGSHTQGRHYRGIRGDTFADLKEVFS